MNRSTMRTILRRRLKEIAADQWEDEVLNELLNQGCIMVQKRDLAVHPERYARRSKISIVNGQDEYPAPQGMWYPLRISRLDTTSTPNVYRQISYLPFNSTLNRGSNAEVRFSLWGRYIVISPTPDASIVDGLRIWDIKTVEMAADIDVPAIPIHLHMAVVLGAEILAKGETEEKLDDSLKIYDLLTYDIANYAQEPGDENRQLDVGDLGKDY